MDAVFFAIGIIIVTIVSKWAVDESYKIGYRHGKIDGLECAKVEEDDIHG